MKKQIMAGFGIFMITALTVTACNATVTQTSTTTKTTGPTTTLSTTITSLSTTTVNTSVPSTVTVPASTPGGVVYWNELSRTVGAAAPGLSDVVMAVTGTRTDVSISGLDYGLALKKDGTVWYWGIHSDNPENYTDSSPVQVAGLSNITAISTGSGNSLALDADGSVWDWGNNYNGQFGIGIPGGGDQPQGTTPTTLQPGQTTTAPIKQPVKVSNLTNVTAISSGMRNCLALKSDGTVWAWGDNEWGQLGDGTTTDRYAPAQVKNLTGVIAISAGHYHSLAVKADGTVWAWGDNESGELGTGDTIGSTVPVQVKGLTGIKSAAAGEAHSLALAADGSVWAWGNNESGQSGDGTVTDDGSPAVTIPVQVPFFINGGVTAISEGGMMGGSGVPGVKTVNYGAGYCLAYTGGTVYTWGASSYSYYPWDDSYNSRPLMITGLYKVKTVSGGGRYAVAVLQ
jgi:alpha-tubulin suppressor-like RCC1 family protein